MPERKGTVRGKRGFTLVEICVVLALLGVVSLLTVTFLTMTGDTLDQNSADYRFLEQSDAVRSALQKKISELDRLYCHPTITGDTLVFTDDQPTLDNRQSSSPITITIGFKDGALKYSKTTGSDETTTTTQDLLSDLTEISTIEFKQKYQDKNQKLIICTVHPVNEKMPERVFAFALRSGEEIGNAE